LNPAAVLGVDNCRLQVGFSTHALEEVRNAGMALEVPVFFFQGDLVDMKDFGRVTHLYGFFGDPIVVQRTAWLIATSTYMKVAVLMCLWKQDLYDVGLVDGDDDERVVWIPKCSMGVSGFTYYGAVIEITPERQAKVRAALEEAQKGELLLLFLLFRTECR
jgi:hypothetical protein